MGRSKRKPTHVHKVVKVEEDETEEESDPKPSRRRSQHTKEDDSCISEDLDLPEGTVVVRPEPVQEKKKEKFKGPEFKTSKKLADDYLAIVTCTACAKQINTGNPGAARRHPVLKVLVCKRCYKYYRSGEFSQDSNGIDEQCRWCGEGGNLFCCDFCSNAFCKGCIKRNLGRSELSKIMDSGEDEQWRCYVCNPRPLSAVMEDCTHVFEQIVKEKKREETLKKKEKGKVNSKNTDASSTPQAGAAELFADMAQKFNVNTDNVHEVIEVLSSASKNFNSLLQTLKSNITAAEEVNCRDINEKHSSRRETKDDLMLRIVKSRCAEMLDKGFNKFMKSVDTCKESKSKRSSSSSSPSPRSKRLMKQKLSMSNKVKELKKSAEKKAATYAEVISVSDTSEDDFQASPAKAKRKLSFDKKSSKGHKKRSSSLSDGDGALEETSKRDKSSKRRSKRSSSVSELSDMETSPRRSRDKSSKKQKKKSTTSSEEDVSEMKSPKRHKSSKERKKRSSSVSEEEETQASPKKKSSKEGKHSPVKPDSSVTKPTDGSDNEMEVDNSTEKDGKQKKTKTDDEEADPEDDVPESPEEMEVEETGSDVKVPSEADKAKAAEDGTEEDHGKAEADCSVSDGDEAQDVQVSSSKQDSRDEDLKLHVTPQKKQRETDTDESKLMSPNTENTMAHLDLLKEMADGISDGENDAGDLPDVEDNDDESSDEDSDDSDVSTPRRKRRKKKKDNTKKEGKSSLKTTKNNKSSQSDIDESESSTKGKKKKKSPTKSKQKDNSSSDDEEEEVSSQRRKKRTSSASSGKGGDKLLKSRRSSRTKGRKSNDKSQSDEESSDSESMGKSKSRRKASKSDEQSSTQSDDKVKLRKKSKKGKGKGDNSGSDDDDDSEDDFAKATKAIDKLCEMPSEHKKRRARKGSESEEETEGDSKSERGSKKDEKKEKATKGKKKRKSKGDSSGSGMSTSEDEKNEDSDDEAEEEEDDPEVTLKIPPKEEDDEAEDSADGENKKAMDSLLAELDGPVSSDTSDSDSSEATPKPKRKKKQAEKSTNEEDGDSSEVGNSRKKKSRKDKSPEISVTSQSQSDSDSDFVAIKAKKRTRNNLLEAKLSDSDSDFMPTKSKAERTNGKENGKGKKRKASSGSDGDHSSSLFHDSDLSVDSEEEKRNKRRSYQAMKKRRRIKAQEDSDEVLSGSGSEQSDQSDQSDDGQERTPGGKRKKIRRILNKKKLMDETKAAAKAEEERRQRVAERQKKYNAYVEQEEDASSPTKCPMTTKLILETKSDSDEVVLEVNKKLVRKLKPHQVQAVQFMWECCCETVSRLRKGPGAGCILAHCMGLGKTLSVISFVHTMLANEKITKLRSCLIVCPLNTVLNWQREWSMWLDRKDRLEVFELSSVKDNWRRADVLRDWQECGGILIIGYEMYRNLTLSNARIKSKKLKKIFEETLVNPGPDLVICDEGHILKNDTSALSKAMSRVQTLRRVVLTGTPLQNNLNEYHCMVNFVKPNLLGTRKEFFNRFVNPITNGQCADSTQFDVKLMKRRAHILHDLLAGCVQRKDYSALTKFLPPKFEYVIAVRLSKVQIELYKGYLSRKGLMAGDGNVVVTKGTKLFGDYQSLMKIWTHPWILRMDEIRAQNRASAITEDSDGSLDSSFINDESSEESESDGSDSNNCIDLTSDSEKGGKKKKRGKKGSSSDESGNEKKSKKGEVVKEWKTRSRGGVDKGEESSSSVKEEPEPEKHVSSEWWSEYVKPESEYAVEMSGKLVLLLDLLRKCEEIGDKILVFSQSLLSLDLIENFLHYVDQQSQEAAANREKEEKEQKKKEKEETGKEKDGKEKKDDKDKQKDKENDDTDKKKGDKENDDTGKKVDKKKDDNDKKTLDKKKDDSDKKTLDKEKDDNDKKSDKKKDDNDKKSDKKKDDKKSVEKDENDKSLEKDDNDKKSDKKKDDKKSVEMEDNDKETVDKEKDDNDKTVDKEKDDDDKTVDKEKTEKDVDDKDDKNKDANAVGADENKDEAQADEKKAEADEKKDGILEDISELFKFGVSWTFGQDYFRMDGSTAPHVRKNYADHFNDPNNYRARLFLISTKAGSLGTNLVAANRVIVFDASWNPSHDIQSIFRVYRFGQTKPVYVYRFLAQGTMEEKIYERQVTKQSLSQRVVDEHQIERHFNARDLQELYNFQPDILDDPNKPARPTPVLPKDHMLADLLQTKKNWIVAYHEHDSLLENQISEELTEEERKAAWEEFEQEKKGVINRAPQLNQQFMMQQAQYMNQQGMPQMMNQGGYGSVNVRPPNVMAIINEMRRRFPNLTPEALQVQVQAVVRQQIAQQILQQQEFQRRQIEQRQFQEQQRLRQIQAQIQQRQQNLESHKSGIVFNNSVLTPNLMQRPPNNSK